MNLKTCALLLLAAIACETAPPPEERREETPADAGARLSRYTTVRLSTAPAPPSK